MIVNGKELNIIYLGRQKESLWEILLGLILIMRKTNHINMYKNVFYVHGTKCTMI